MHRDCEMSKACSKCREPMILLHRLPTVSQISNNNGTSESYSCEPRAHCARNFIPVICHRPEDECCPRIQNCEVCVSQSARCPVRLRPGQWRSGSPRSWSSSAFGGSLRGPLYIGGRPKQRRWDFTQFFRNPASLAGAEFLVSRVRPFLQSALKIPRMMLSRFLIDRPLHFRWPANSRHLERAARRH